MTPAGEFAPGAVYSLLADDHARLERLLDRATAVAGVVGADDYAAFRKGLLRHIGMEEKILLPAAQRARGGDPLPAAARLRLDHGALAALLVPTPTPAIVAGLRAILADHNAVEEGPDGVYAACERLVGDAVGPLLAALREAGDIPVAPHVDGPRIMAATRRALSRAGYELAEDEGRE